MKKHLLTIVIIFMTLFATSQVAYFQALSFTDSVTSPGIKKYGIKMSFPGLNIPLTYKVVDNTSGLEYTGDSIADIFNSNTVNRTVNCYAFEPSNLTDPVGIAQINPARKSMINMGQLLSTTGTNCDGEFKLNIDTNNIGYAGQQTYYGIYSPSGILTNLIATGSNTIGGLCSHKYVVLVNAVVYSGPWAYTPWVEECTLLIGHYAFPGNSTYSVSVNVLAPTSGAICVGEAKVIVTPQPPQPPTFSLDGGTFNTVDSLTNLCAGYHFINMATLTDTIGKTFFINTVSDTITNPNYNGVIVDTVIYNYNNCNFNYNNPIDSAFISSYNIINSNQVYVEWQIWNSGLNTQIADTINYNFQSGNNMISLYMYCSNAQKGTSGYRAKKINDFKLINSNVPTGIKSNSPQQFKIFPNPFHDIIYVQETGSEHFKIGIINILGQSFESKASVTETSIKNYKINTELLSPGIYFIELISDNDSSTNIKLIKN
ncbi:MAG: T9SS type A sorting domain-containing protein [Bacteroidota bacterium]